MPYFDFVVVGCGGGPSETDLSAYLVKPFDGAWKDGIIAIEAGSGLGALRKVVKAAPDLFPAETDDESTPRYHTAVELHSYIQNYLISHAHLDHVNGLVLSAGSQGPPRRRVYATQSSLKTLESIFSDRIWPNLASWKDEDCSHMLQYSTLAMEEYQEIDRGISVRTMPISHGHNDTVGTYDSAAFFLRHDASAREFVFFGDVEPDTISRAPRNAAVWLVAADKIAQGMLDTVFIECSWPSGRSDAQLYGHLTPEHLVAELGVLATEVLRRRQESSKDGAAPPVPDKETSPGPARKKRRPNHAANDGLRGALDGIRVYIIHCKDDMEDKYDRPIANVIVDQVKALVEEKLLGADIIAAEQGMHISI